MRQGAQGWCTGMTLRDGMGKEVEERVRMGNTYTPMADSCECMARPLGTGALGLPRGMVWGGRWEEGSGWGTHVRPWLIHITAARMAKTTTILVVV